MYSDKENVNMLTALLLAHGVKNAVLCPGSRNAPIVHNLAQVMHCVSVVDERSAGYYAIGMALQTSEPVVVCVTSGTALSNLLPATTEAHYRHLPLIIISADRPEAWINQLDGQTIEQVRAIKSVVGHSVQLPEVKDEIGRWHCNRLINEALIACRRNACQAVHINVPISEALYNFSLDALPSQRCIKEVAKSVAYGTDECNTAMSLATRPLVIVGQTKADEQLSEAINSLVEKGYVVIGESLAVGTKILRHCEQMLSLFDSSPTPDVILYIGDNLISKDLKTWLRRLKGVPTYRLSDSDAIEDMTTHCTAIIKADVAQYLKAFPRNNASNEWQKAWQKANVEARAKIEQLHKEEGVLGAIAMLLNEAEHSIISTANSLAVRMVDSLANRFVHCNRGTNGIEGSLSTACGISLMSEAKVYHITGDLSFFYDANALWNAQLAGNLRILLVNNGGGAIFSKFEGLKGSAARETYVMAKHGTNAEGICKSYNVQYRQVAEDGNLADAIAWLCKVESRRPVLLEIISDNAKY